MKNAIILCGGTGSRLFPLTKVVSKQLITLNNKFIVEYPIQTLKQMGIQNLSVVLGDIHFGQIVEYLQDGSRYGMNLNYIYQPKPNGIAAAINMCKRYVADDDQFVVILGDNIFENPIQWNNNKCEIVLYGDTKNNPEIKRFGIASLDKTQKIVNIEEKPNELNNEYDNYAITGCYKFDQNFFEYFNKISPSPRGEYEITDIIKQYHKNNSLGTTIYNDALWADAGNFETIKLINDYFFKNGTT